MAGGLFLGILRASPKALCWAVCGLPGIGKSGEIPASFHPLSCGTPATVPLAWPLTQQYRGAIPGWVAGEQCRVRWHWGAGFAHGCLLTICKCKKRPRGGRGHPAHRGCLHSGRGPAQVEGPPLPGTPRAPLGSFPWPRGQLGPEQTGLFAHAGISCSLCSFDFLFPLCHILLWGLQRGLGPPSLPLEAQVCFLYTPLPCTDILGMPIEHIWVACGDNSCATRPWSPPIPPLLPGTSGCPQHLGEVGANGFPPEEGFPALCTL